MTKTLIDIDDELMAQAMHVTGAQTKKAAVNEALAQIVRRSAALGYVDIVRNGIVVELDDSRVTDSAQR